MIGKAMRDGAPDGPDDYDVVVVGAGPAGAAHAIELTRTGRTVALVGREPNHPRGTLELLSGRTRPALSTLGVLDTVLARGTECAGAVFRWGRGRFTERPGDADPWGGGWVVDRQWFDPLLRATAVGVGVHHLAATVSSIDSVGDTWRLYVTSTSGQEDPRHRVVVRAGRIVFATGRVGKLATRCGLERRVRHRMVALTAWLPEPIENLGCRLLVDPSPHGWWYALGDEAGTVVGYVTDTDLLAPGSNRVAATWSAALAETRWLPPATRSAELVLRAGLVGEVVVRERDELRGKPVPIGDIAIAADPLSGHGLILALDGAIRAARDPDGYPAWLLRAQAAHRSQERAVYGDERRYPGAEFWCRRRR